MPTGPGSYGKKRGRPPKRKQHHSYETFTRSEPNILWTPTTSMEFGYEIISFVLDCCGTWRITFYLGPIRF